MLPNGLVQLLSENILEVPDALDQHKLQPKKHRSITKLFLNVVNANANANAKDEALFIFLRCSWTSHLNHSPNSSLAVNFFS